MPLVFNNRKLLFARPGKLAMSTDCCCCIDTCFRFVFEENRLYVTDRTNPSAVAAAERIGGMTSSRIVNIKYGSTEEVLSSDGVRPLDFGSCGTGSASMVTAIPSYFGPPWEYEGWGPVWERRITTVEIAMKRRGIVSFHYKPPLGAWRYGQTAGNWAAATYVASMSLALSGCDDAPLPATIETDIDEIGDNPNPYSLYSGYSEDEYSAVFRVQ